MSAQDDLDWLEGEGEGGEGGEGACVGEAQDAYSDETRLMAQRDLDKQLHRRYKEAYADAAASAREDATNKYFGVAFQAVQPFAQRLGQLQGRACSLLMHFTKKAEGSLSDAQQQYLDQLQQIYEQLYTKDITESTLVTVASASAPTADRDARGQEEDAQPSFTIELESVLAAEMIKLDQAETQLTAIEAQLIQ
eukprot:m.354055 g.354055  ORF g.354055 m.354055 type:complete len:194 (-) comp16909_c0_seq1:252-833(-)